MWSPGMPNVTVIVPCYNEQDTIQLLLEAICNQTYRLDEIEVVIADGMSSDRTRAVISPSFKTLTPGLNCV
jgi:glycosyltransferase involved in cell wall biosynthesis